MDTIHTPATAISISPIQRATSVWLATSTSFGPPPKPTHHLYMPQFCWREHIQWTQSLDTSHTPKPLDPTLEWVTQHSHLFHPVADLREQVVLEIRQLVEDMQELTDDWLRDLLQHVQKAHTTRKPVAQVPVFTRLLRQIDYPQADILHQELSSGFQLMGQLQPGTNWYLRSDNKYLMPKTQEEFAEHNDHYVQRKLQQARVDDHYEMMLEEIVQEVKMGRMNGPFTAPPHWEHQTITPSKYPGQMAKRRSDEAKIGAAADTTQHASCTTNLTITHQITSQPLPSDHTNTTLTSSYTCGDTIMTEPTDNCLLTNLNKLTSYSTLRKGPPCGATTSSYSDPQPASGDTTDSAMPWCQCQG